MSTVRIKKSIDITVNLGDCQFVKLSSGTERDVEFSTNEEKVGSEAAIWHELCQDLNASLRNCLEDLGKTTEAPAAFAKACMDKLDGKVPVTKKGEGIHA